MLKKHERKKEQIMIMFIIFVALLGVLGLASMRWGFDTRYGMDSPEWQRWAILQFPLHRA